MANTWLETTLRPNTLPKPPPTTLDRKRSHSMISSVQYRPLTTLQPNIPALDTMHDTMHSPKALRPMSGGRCSLPPIRDLLEVADLGTAGVARSQVQPLDTTQSDSTIPRAFPPAFIEPQHQPTYPNVFSPPGYQIRPTTSWPSSHPPLPLLAPPALPLSASMSQVDPALIAMDSRSHRQSFASTASASSARSTYSRASYSASSPEGSARPLGRRPLGNEFNPQLPTLDSPIGGAPPVWTGDGGNWSAQQYQQQHQYSRDQQSGGYHSPPTPTAAVPIKVFTAGVDTAATGITTSELARSVTNPSSPPFPAPLTTTTSASSNNTTTSTTSTTSTSSTTPTSLPRARPTTSLPAYSITTASSTERYLCASCGRGFSRPSSLQIHNNTHTGEKPFICPVGGCGKRFSVRSNMRRHEKSHVRGVGEGGGA